MFYCFVAFDIQRTNLADDRRAGGSVEAVDVDVDVDVEF